VSASKQLETA